jgi:hypothetical protein
MSDEIQRVLIIAVALALVVVVALVLKRRLSLKYKDTVVSTGGRERAIDQSAMAKGTASKIEDATQDATSNAVGSQRLDARSGGQITGVRQTIRDPEKRP